VRLFIAVNFPESLKSDIRAATEALRRAAPSVRWTDPRQLHITLKFLGQTTEALLPAIKSGIARATASTSPFPIELGGVGGFPNLRRPRVYWLGVREGGLIVRLQGSVEREIEPLGFPKEDREFRAHLTIGRVGREVAMQEMQAAERAAAEIDYHVQARVSSVELMQSHLSPKGARYETLASMTLGTGT
jgi:RNA 2',3'-cyclic 3'-phosphodiesterase